VADLELLFSTRAELEGARQWEAQLERSIGKAKAMGKDTAELEAQLGKLKTSTAASEKALADSNKTVADAAPKLNETAKATDDLGQKKTRLREAARGLSLELPLVGRVLGFLTSPLTIVTALVGVAVGKFNDWNNSIKELGRQQAELAAFRDTLLSLSIILKDIEHTRLLEAINAIGQAASDTVSEMGKLNAEIDKTQARKDELEDLQTEARRQEIKTGMASGSISDADGRRRLAALDNESDERKAQREFRTLQQQKQNMENTLRDLDPQLARLQQTPDADLARMKKRASDQEQLKANAENELKTTGPKLKEEIGDAEATLTAFRQGKGVDVREWMKFGIAGGGHTKQEIDSKISEFIEGKQREYDSLVKAKDFETEKAQKLTQRVGTAEAENAQIGKLKGTEDTLRQGIKDADTEIDERTKHNRESLRLRRGIRSGEIDEADHIEDQRRREKAQRERSPRGASAGGGGDFNRVASSAQSVVTGSEQIAGELQQAFAAMKAGQDQILRVLEQHKREIHQIDSRAKNARV